MKDGDRVAGKRRAHCLGRGGVREVSAAGGGNSIHKADGGFMLPVALSSAPGEGLRSGFVIP